MSVKGAFQPQSLDIDENIIERNLLICDDDKDSGNNDPFLSKVSEISSLLPEESYPAIQVTPTPGMCIKSKNVKGQKVFINLCKIMEIPPPPPITEEKLCEIIEKDDYSTSYRVPMSLGAPRKEVDKSGNPCLTADVAVNSIWFDQTMENSLVFTTFVVNLAMEGLCDKYGDEVNLDRNGWTILKNKKYHGKLQRHNIQQRSSKIKEVGGGDQSSQKEDDELLMKARIKKPKFKITADRNPPKFLVAEISLPGIKTVRDFTLDVGEDRLILEAQKAGYFLDIFLPFNFNQDETVAQYHRDSQLLTVTLPVV